MSNPTTLASSVPAAHSSGKMEVVVSPGCLELARLLCRSPWDLEEVAGAVRQDPKLSAKLISAARTFCGTPRGQTSVEDAIMRLGPGVALALGLSASFGPWMQRALPAHGLEEGELWRHAIACALAIEESRNVCRMSVAPYARAAALLHDVGKLLEPPTTETDHAQAAANWLRDLGLPEVIACGIRFHHEPLRAPAGAMRILCHQIWLADAVASEIGAPCGNLRRQSSFSPALAGSLGIGLQGFQQLSARVGERLESVLSFYGR